MVSSSDEVVVAIRGLLPEAEKVSHFFLAGAMTNILDLEVKVSLEHQGRMNIRAEGVRGRRWTT